MQEYSYIGKGKVFLSKLGDNRLRYVGNCDKVELSLSEETKELKDFTSAGGGVVNTVSRIDKIEISLNLFDFSPENLAMAIYGKAINQVSGEVIAEHQVAYRNHLVRLQHSNISNVVVEDWIHPNNKYEQGIDYEVLNAGIFILESGNVEQGTTLKIDYHYKATDVIQALIHSGDEYQLIFDGLNEAQSGKKVVLDLYRIKFTPAASLSFIGDDFGSIEIKGTALADNSKSGVGVSRYFKVEMEQ